MITISPKAFFFDFDGVICDTERFHMLATMDVLKEHGIEFTEAYYFELLFGFSDKGLFEHLFEINDKDLSADLLEKLIAQKNDVFLEMIDKKIVYMDGVVDLIKKFAEKSIPLCVVSGSLKQEVDICLASGNLEQYFKFIIAADMVNNSKPDPESYEIAYQEMCKIVPDLKREDCWVLEDSPTGIDSAKGANLKVIGITNTTTRDNLLGSDFIVNDYDEIEIF